LGELIEGRLGVGVQNLEGIQRFLPSFLRGQ